MWGHLEGKHGGRGGRSGKAGRGWWHKGLSYEVGLAIRKANLCCGGETPLQMEISFINVNFL
jgi:hypothetical protein